MQSLSALITVYHRIDPGELRAALDSLRSQTRRAEEIIIVADGPLGSELDAVIDAFLTEAAEARILRLPENQGAGPASQAGWETITTEFTARLDADDIAYPERFATQLAYFAAHPELDVLGTALQEFTEAPGDGEKIRSLPEKHAEIAKYALINSPVNNPSVMMRTERVNQVGGYRNIHHMEDYDLYARLLADGACFHNLPVPLTFFRVSPAQFQRRTGKGMFAAEWQMQRNLVSYGLISRPRAALNLAARTGYRLLPAALLRRVYGALFHR
ncbi:MAG TPA: glycosyltransferase [Corynebacterium sp.]|nr:glycosyltransferase [Corynebacterium sp.]